jgi:SAM-dependent methyltransferase
MEAKQMQMESYGPQTYGERAADLYDEWHRDLPGLHDCVECLAELAGPGPVLELGVGTGRVALPLVRRGLQVHGIDASPAMLAKLRAKPGGDRVRVIVGDMAEVSVDASYTLVFAVFNTLFALVSQDEQVRCFANVAGRLADGGVFVVEAFVPDPGGRQEVRALRVTVDSVLLAVSREDPVAQRIEAQQVLLGPEGVRLVPGVLRYAWPAELDLMARLAGLRLRERWGGWRREPFTADSHAHVSVYEHE